MLEWALHTALAHRLADMLRYAGAEQLAAGVDPGEIVHIVPIVADEAGRALACHSRR